MTKEDAFEDIYKLIQNKGVDIYESKTLSEQEKLDYIDATLDVMRFIKTKIKEKETQDRDDMARELNWLEHLVHTQKVTGSIPVLATIKIWRYGQSVKSPAFHAGVPSSTLGIVTTTPFGVLRNR